MIVRLLTSATAFCIATGGLAAAQSVAPAVTPSHLRLSVEPDRPGQPKPAGTVPESPRTNAGNRDPVIDGIGRGALIGAGGGVALFRAALNSCRKGCEAGAPMSLMLAGAALGAGLGSLVGFAADLDAGAAVRSDHFFSGRPTPQIGVGYMHTSFVSRALDGSRATQAYTAAVQLSPHLSVHVEYMPVDHVFTRSAGAVPGEILQNVIEATSRVAGRSHGIDSRRVSYMFSELVGIHPAPWGRMRVEFLAGLAVRGQENRDFYDAHRATDDRGRTEPVPGKYYVLDFETPEIGVVLGADVEFKVMRHVIVVPTVRYYHMGDPAPSIAFGIGARLRF